MALREAIIAATSKEGDMLNICPSELAFELVAQLQSMGYEIVDKDSYPKG